MADSGSPFKLAGEGLDHWLPDDSCSYCGSLNEAILMARLDAGDVELIPSDKSYKTYVRNVGGAGFRQSYRDCPRDSEDHGPDACSHWVTRETSETKFYFQHLSREQKIHFVELLNAKRIHLAYPGHFYVLPFFCTMRAQP
jgi:hypothetical protein